ncbi:MAG TPA: thioredoxin domain-containing protein [Acidobacteria bacterium]|nr:thioredoxin domain-containing protein [Acidobacteriota bacterium]
MSPEDGEIKWRDWTASTFAFAAAEQKPVLLAIGPAWCRGTEEMHRVSYTDPDVVQVVTEQFVPVRVDPDRRPDIGERYTLDGWPTTAFLTPSGVLLGGGGHLDPARLIVVLRQVRAAFAARPDAGNPETDPPSRDDDAAPLGLASARLDADAAGRWFDDQLRTRFDPTWAGFGPGPKRAHTSALKAALLRGRHASSSGDLTDIVNRTLDAIADGGLVDTVEGGFFRYCEQPDWSRPHVEKVLTPNARLVDLFLTASRILGRSHYAKRAADTIRFVHDTLSDADGGFFASQRADPDYSALTTTPERERHGAPPVDRSVYVDATVTMASAYVLGAAVLADSSLLEFAATAVDRVVMETYARGGGVGHVVNGRPPIRGLLSDQVAASAALLDLYEASGQDVYLDMPQELMAYCQQEMWDEGDGFRDRIRGSSDHSPPIGLLREPHRPFALNCDAAVVLGRLAALTDQTHYREQALRVLASQTSVYQARGLDGADYILALEQLQTLAGP